MFSLDTFLLHYFFLSGFICKHFQRLVTLLRRVSIFVYDVYVM